MLHFFQVIANMIQQKMSKETFLLSNNLVSEHFLIQRQILSLWKCLSIQN